MNQFSHSQAAPPDTDLYDQDFVLWIERQVEFLRSRQLNLLDVDHLLGELDAMSESQLRELRNRLIVLLIHLLKCRYQPQRKSSEWVGTLGEQRTQLALLLEQSPSLRTALSACLDSAYAIAVVRAANETRLSTATFPATNPFSETALLDLEFIP